MQELERSNSVLERELKSKEQENNNLMTVMESERQAIKSLENEKQRAMKMEVLSQNMTQRNEELTNRLE